MAGEVSSAGIKISYCAEATAGTRPTSGYKEKATSATLKIAEYVTGISGLTAEFEQYDVTPLAEQNRHRFVKGLQGNDWGLIVSAYEALTGGKGMWFAFTLPGDTQSAYFRCIPCPMGFPDVEAASAVQGAVQLIENEYAGWAANPTT